MAVVYGSGFELGSAAQAWQSGGTYSYQTTTKRTGAYALRTNPATTGVGYNAIGAPGLGSINASNVATSYNRFFFLFATKPTVGDEEFFAATGANAYKLALRLNSSGIIAAYDSTGTTLLGTGTTVLSANTWYRIEVMCGTGTSAAWEVKINGASEISGSGANLGTVNLSLTSFGKRTNRNGNSVDFYFDDWLLNDAAYPGDGAHIMLVPNANGTYQTFSIGAGSGSHYQQVDEVPADYNATYLLSAGTIGNAETEALTDCATAGISGTINAVFPLMIASRNATGASIKLRLRSATTDSDGAAWNLGGAWGKSDALYATDPATGLAWTTGGLDGAEVGAVENATTNQTQVTFVGLMVDFTAGGGGGIIPTPYYRLLAGMGNL